LKVQKIEEKLFFSRFFKIKNYFSRGTWQFFSIFMFTTHICIKKNQVAE
jgi:hypothetical protein